MKFFPIVPIGYLGRLAGLFPNQMVLAQWLTEKRYLNFYKRRREKGDFIILDNGACELGKSLPIEELAKWYQALGGCDVLVIPDSNTTNIELFEDFMHHHVEQEFNGKVSLMAVPHSLEDLEVMIRFAKVDYIGLNRDFEDYGRAKVIQQYKDYRKKFHLLGIRRNPVEEIIAVKPFGDLILGVDSSFPYRLFSRGRRIEEHRPFPPHDSMYQKDLSAEILDFCVGEFKSFLEWVSE